MAATEVELSEAIMQRRRVIIHLRGRNGWPTLIRPIQSPPVSGETER